MLGSERTPAPLRVSWELINQPERGGWDEHGHSSGKPKFRRSWWSQESDGVRQLEATKSPPCWEATRGVP